MEGNDDIAPLHTLESKKTPVKKEMPVKAVKKMPWKKLQPVEHVKDLKEIQREELSKRAFPVCSSYFHCHVLDPVPVAVVTTEKYGCVDCCSE